MVVAVRVADVFALIHDLLFEVFDLIILVVDLFVDELLVRYHDRECRNGDLRRAVLDRQFVYPSSFVQDE